ncbi:unnamed protein product [Microthlaspi erraticum]|uniref:SHSP domain-containing protein n=1 Tax=Microthlaspi erraticum TaxID=1685480 RepID=A0A6D2IP64_9BRAS|nr:unnamed protein product [Microthlaspi erraticum]
MMSKAAGSSGDKSGTGGYSDRDWPKNFPPIPRNRFQKTGSQAPYETIDTKDACVMRVDMPGCPMSELVYYVEGNNVHFFADEPSSDENNHEGRKYGGTAIFDPRGYNVKETKAKLRNGVLWITIPKKIPGKNAKVSVTELMFNAKITREDVV